MVLVIFGNVPIPFPRLAEKIAEISGRSAERFVIQKGCTEHPFPKAQASDFLSANELARLMGEAEVVVTHGGYGTISEAMKMGKKIVAVPRLEGEHNHSQRELVEALEREGCLLAVYEIADLEKKIGEARVFVPKPLPPGNATRIINDFIRANFPSQ